MTGLFSKIGSGVATSTLKGLETVLIGLEDSATFNKSAANDVGNLPSTLANSDKCKKSDSDRLKLTLFLVTNWSPLENVV